MRIALLSAFLLFCTFVKSQYLSDHYKQYKIVYDDSMRYSEVVDTITGSRVRIDFSFTEYRTHTFMHGFIYVRTSDMKALMRPTGEKLIGASHFINFDAKDSLISAYICSDGAWIYMNFNGDTLSYGPANNNYTPPLKDSLNPTPGGSRRGTVKWGYLDKKARWAIKPQFEDAKPFENGRAKVKLNGKWGLIDNKGKFIKKPMYGTEEF